MPETFVVITEDGARFDPVNSARELVEITRSLRNRRYEARTAMFERLLPEEEKDKLSQD